MQGSLVVQTTARLLVPALLLASLLVLWRGHHEPGGGFIAGLVAVGAFALHALAYGRRAARRFLLRRPEGILAAGLAVAIGSMLVAPARGEPFATAQWITLGPIELGTPLLFDLGVYLVVIGFALSVLRAVDEEES